MSNAPERIKVEPSGDWSDLWDASDEKRTGTGAEVLYVRADIHDAVIAERDRLRADLDAQIEWFWSCPIPMSEKSPFSPGNFGRPLRKAGSTLRALPIEPVSALRPGERVTLDGRPMVVGGGWTMVSGKSAEAVSLLEAHGWRWEHGAWQPAQDGRSS